jgi:hypothetical protein
MERNKKPSDVSRRDFLAKTGMSLAGISAASGYLGMSGNYPKGYTDKMRFQNQNPDGILKKGKIFNESVKFADLLTGRAARRLTQYRPVNQQPAYHLNTCFSADSRYMILTTTMEDGTSALLRAEVATGEMVVLEIVPKGHKPALNHDNWKEGLIPVQFPEISRAIEINSVINKAENGTDFSVNGKIPALKGKGWIAVTTEFDKAGKPFQSLSNRPVSMTGNLDGNSVEFEAALNNPLFPAPWQTYRLQVNENSSGKEFQLSCKTVLKKDVDLIIKGHYVPLDDNA